MCLAASFFSIAAWRVHRGVQLTLGGLGDVQFLGQRGAVPMSGVGQLGTGEEEAFGDHGDHQVASPRRPGCDQLVHAEPANHGQDSLDMPVGEGPRDPEGLAGRYEQLPLEGTPDQVDQVIGEMG
jgi:hypothetical protein